VLKLHYYISFIENIKIIDGINDNNKNDIVKWTNEKGKDFLEQWAGTNLDFPLTDSQIDDLKEYIEQALEQMLKRNCTRTKFSERFKRIIDSYNAGGTENEDYYEQLVKLLEELRQEDNRANTEGLTEEELEIYDLLVAGKKLTQVEEQKVKLSAKNLFKKLMDNRSNLLVVDWYKDEQPRAKLKYEVELSLNQDLPESYDKAAFDSKVTLLINHFVDMAVQGYGWIGLA